MGIIELREIGNVLNKIADHLFFTDILLLLLNL